MIGAFRPAGSRAGFTLPEVMIAGSLSTLIAAAVMSVFMWAGRQTSLCSKISSAQTESRRTSAQLERYLRNARALVAIDESQGNWVEVRFTDGSLARLSYTNEPGAVRSGRLSLVRNGEERILASGLTRIPSPEGYSLPLFTRVNDRAVRIAFRIASLGPGGRLTADDGAYASCARFAVCLRNARE
jgi:hypothetical protein